MKSKDKRNKAGDLIRIEGSNTSSCLTLKNDTYKQMDPEYEVVQDAILYELIKRINCLMRAGYRPIGGATYCPKMGVWYQTILRE